nr:pyridoxal-phosphate dependent enzyme [Chloroflexota bacterium]
MSFVIRCMDCGYSAPFNPSSMHCPQCNSQWRAAEYDLAQVAKTFPSKLKDRPFDLWRYIELLPINEANPTLRLGEGGTPLIQAANLGMMLGLPNLFIKDERQGPTSSFKDRQAAVTIAALKEGGVTEMVAASTGNVAKTFPSKLKDRPFDLWRY